MKIIDLLNKIANGEEVPKKYRYKNKEYEEDYCYMLYEETGDCNELNFKFLLNDEVEIIEEEKKIPEKITINDNGTIGFSNGEWTARNMDKAFAIKFNQLIDYLKSKGE